MNNTFDFKRFGKYFRYDVVSAWQNAGINLLVTAALPVGIFAIQQLFSIIFKGYFDDINLGLIAAAYLLSFAFTVVFFPVQHYGRLTDKKAGSDWLMIPASRLEKFISMLLVTCVAVPLVWFITITACDGLLSLVFNTYPQFALTSFTDGIDKLLAEFHSETIDIAINGPYALYLSWCGNILTFTLGAIIFRKNKVVYTILSMFAIGIFISVAAGIIMNGDMNLAPEDISEDRIMRILNWTMYIIYIVEFTLLNLGIFFRIKTLKH